MPRIRPVPISKLQESPVDLEQELKVPVKRSNRSNYIYHRPKQRQFNGGGAVQDNVAEKRSKSTNDFNKDLYCIDDDMEICQSGNS